MALPQGIEWLVILGTVGFTVALLPQLVRTLRLGRAEDISIPFILLVVAASILTFIYWVIRGEPWYVTSGFAANAIVWSIVLWYRVFPRPGALDPAPKDS